MQHAHGGRFQNLESYRASKFEKVCLELSIHMDSVELHFLRGLSFNMAKKPHGRRPPLPPLPCALPYDAAGQWSPATTAAARECVLRNLDRDVSWWRRQKKDCDLARRRIPDVDATLCRVRSQGPRSVLTNMMLVRSVHGRLQAMILQDPGDERGPMRHWPGRPVAAIQQLAAVQRRIDEGVLPPLPNFTAVLNPHDQPYQVARYDWCAS